MKNSTNYLDKIKNVFHVFKKSEPIIEKPTSNSSDTNEFVVKGLYTSNELSGFYRRRENAYTSSTAQTQTNVLLQYLNIVSANTKSSEEKIKNLVALNPEIGKAKQIYVASMMSPNDLQEELIKVTVEDPSMDIDLKEEIEVYLNDFFNIQLDFGGKLSEYIGEYTYECDAKPIMILPKANISSLLDFHKQLDRDPNKIFTESEHLCFNIKEKNNENYDSLMIEKIYSEAWEVFEPHLDASGKIDGKQKIIRQQADATYKFIQSNADCCNFTTDIAKISKIKQYKQDKMVGASQDILKNMYSTFYGSGTNILAIDDKESDENIQPILLELPSAAVIPIIIPGSKTEHMGYFVLMDEWGNPLTNFNDQNTLSDNDGSLSRVDNRAMFNTGNQLFGNNLFQDPKTKYEINESIFSIAMKQIFKDKFDKNGNLDLPLNEFGSLSKFLFHQMLHKNKTTVLFVPESLIVYYCDSYKSDGTGQSKISSIEFVLSLRTNLLIAGVMGGIRAAIDKEVIEVTIDQKNLNPEQTIEMIRNAAVEKKKLNFSSANPSFITRSIADSAISIMPKGLKGLDFELTRSKDSSASEYRPADDNLLEFLTNMYQAGLTVPPAALNKTSEEEFATSITTNNIIFSNEIRKAQKKLKPKNKKLLSTYLKFSRKNQSDMLEIYRKYHGKNAKANGNVVDDKEATGEITITIRADQANISSNGVMINPMDIPEAKPGDYTKEEKLFLQSVISNIEANLPAPDIAVTKRHLEDMNSELEFLNVVLDNVYNEDTIYTQTTEHKDFLKSMLANIRAEKVKELLAKSTYHRSMKFPELEDFDLGIIKDKLHTIMNKSKGVANFEAAIMKAMESGDTPPDDAGNEPPADDNTEFDF